MKTTIKTKQLTTYVLPAIAIGLTFAIFPVTFSLLGYIQFFVGLFQLAIALFKLVYIFLKHKTVPLPLKHYWLAVAIYFLVMAIGGFFINMLTHDFNKLFSTVGLFYLGLAWGIAIYHFKKIMFL
jgi:hypothetical protein